jgi:hypothetical protein
VHSENEFQAGGCVRLFAAHAAVEFGVGERTSSTTAAGSSSNLKEALVRSKIGLQIPERYRYTP